MVDNTEQPFHPAAQGEVTRLLGALSGGDGRAADDLLPMVYGELRKLAQHLMAGEKPGQTLTATALVHEAYLRLVGSERESFNDRRHFFNAAAQAMRRTLVERGRRSQTHPHADPFDSIDIPLAREFEAEQMQHVDLALRELAAHNERWHEVVQLRFCLGLTIDRTSELIGVSDSTVKRDWNFARAWLRVRVKQLDEDG